MRTSMKISRLLVLIAGCTLPAGLVMAEPPVCPEGQFCVPPQQAGQESFESKVLMRRDGDTPPSAEYRRPADEVLTLRDGDADKLKTDQAVIEPFVSGWHTLTDNEKSQLAALAQRLQGKQLERVEIIGHADLQRLTPQARQRYADNRELSAARAAEVAMHLRTLPLFASVPMFRTALADKNPVVTNCDGSKVAQSPAMMRAYKACLSGNRRVEVRIWAKPEPKPNDVCGAPRGQTQVADLPFRISVDGQPVAAADMPNSADHTRCTDIALEKADLQVRYDALETTPVLNVTAWPDGAVRGGKVAFTPYSNYLAFITKAELRIFRKTSSEQQEPLAVLPLEKSLAQPVSWEVPNDPQLNEVFYVLRVFDEDGRFDETEPKPLKLMSEAEAVGDEQSAKREMLIGYGENHRLIKNINVVGGAVTVNGTGLKDKTQVWVMNQPVPVDSDGKFAFRQIVPAGDHQVSVVTEERGGQRSEFNRTLYVPDNDWFYIALGDLTVGHNNVKGAADLVTDDEDAKRVRKGAYVDGRAAFYVKGKIKGEYLLTASADTQEQPIEDMFTNFNRKDPRYLLRRIDPNAYYPVYGDDSTMVEDAPTRGKFYVKLARGDSHVMWGNFQTRITGTDLVNYNRGLYGAHAEFNSDNATKYGERKTQVQGFVADPGTLGALEEFRGTGGSLFYLRNQDLVIGSERLRIEVRDRDSGIVLKTTYLTASQDYEINYIQGRVILREPLSSTVDGATLVMVNGSLSGNPAYLVANYEYAPTISSIENWTTGGRASQWLTDNIRVGATAYQQNGSGLKQKLVGADTTLRYAPGTYAKLEMGRSEGAGSGTQSSPNGGFNFAPIAQTFEPDITAYAWRAETGLDFAEMIAGTQGRVAAYFLRRENGYSAPGQFTNEGVTQTGLTGLVPLNDRLDLNAKADIKEGQTTGTLKAGELGADYKLTKTVTLSGAGRFDERETNRAAGLSEILAETGGRTDLAGKVLYQPRGSDGEPADWEIYGIGQATVQKSGNRRDNNRGGAGGRYQLNERLALNGEATAGDGGWGGKAGAEYRSSDRTTYYTNYVLDTDRTDNGYRGRQSNFAMGGRSRYTDSMSVFAEQRRQSFDGGPSGLIHSFGLDLAATDRWNLGGRFERGTISDPNTGDFLRNAFSLSPGYVNDKTKYAGNFEWRNEYGDQIGERNSWLVRNNLSYQTNPDWRLLSGFNFALSESDRGSNLTADFTEVKLGYAYRPVDNDRLNALFKYTYLEEQGSPAQVRADGTTSLSGYAQRSHVLSADAIYDLTERLALGGKFGYRVGMIRDNNLPSPEWFASQAWLAVGRLDYSVIYAWDIMGELRYLDAQEAEDAKFGALVGIYRHIDENIKMGVGYNFTDFSDDLTDLSYQSRGVFFNAVAKF
jgi:outer membrane protein OmpA-like peptidoglycan-associated protein